MAADPPSSPAVAEIVDTIADRFESDFRAGRRPGFASYLEGLAPSHRRPVFAELIRQEVELRRAAGEQPEVLDYRGWAPEFADLIAEALDLTPVLGARVTPPAPSLDEPSPFRTRCLPRQTTLTITYHHDRDRAGDSEAEDDPVDGPLGNYWLIDRLGAGGMGVVYRARQDGLVSREVAVKMILAGHLRSAEAIAQFVREARAMATLEVPHVVPILDSGDDGGRFYYAMPYYKGGNLAHQLRRLGRFEPRRAAEVVRTIARAVAALHERRLVHCDLKPANILLDERDEPHVADFGLARILEPASRHAEVGRLIGTIPYMAPEQADSQRAEVGFASDIYSLGVILYELLTGRRPFQGATVAETRILILDSEPTNPRQINPDIPRELEQICLKCLEKDPVNRYESADELVEDLTNFLLGEPLTHQTALGPIHQIHRWMRREPALAARAAAGLACSLVLWTFPMTFGASGAVEVGETLPGLSSLSARLGVQAFILLWVFASAIYQRLFPRFRDAEWIRTLWQATDLTLFTAVLMLTVDPARSPLVIAYAVLIASSGFWYRPRTVWSTGGIAIAAFLGLVGLDALQGRPPHRYQIQVLIALITQTAITAAMVRRVQALNRFSEGRIRSLTSQSRSLS